MFSQRRFARLLRLVSVVIAVLCISFGGDLVRGQSVPVTFTLNPALSALVGSGTVTGPFAGPGTSTTVPIGIQVSLNFVLGNSSKWAGTVNTQVGYDPGALSPIRLMATSASIAPTDIPGQTYLPGTWDSVNSVFLPGRLPAQYAFLVAGVVTAAIRNSAADLFSGNNVVTGTAFPSNFQLEYTAGVLSLNPAAIGEDQSEDQLTASIPDPFTNGAAATSTLTSANAGGSNYNLGMTLKTQATASFMLGDYAVSFIFTGDLVGTGTTFLPRAGDATGEGNVTGADYAIWAANFGLFNTSQNALYNQGDFSGDGKVTGADYALWANNFGVPPAAAALPNAVPEPSTLALGLLGVVGLSIATMRKRFAGK